ncbi:MAG: hypothetical protein JF597_46270 [Streptomyces sp.]|uniref:hypothetical protein n=1 Tax=Streptomyces sp. TaxID=1931 RepID=UPI0025D964D4|nr:hypothetical protein [Streptomyces sp.]MBW8800712.1 hypothetical protein [Streptomyces sp.]
MPCATGPQVGAADSLGETGGGDEAGAEGASEVGGTVDGSAEADDDPGFGEVTVTPEDEVGRADADALGRAVPFPVPDAGEEAPADGVVPPLTAGPATEAPSSEVRGDRAGRGESSTLPAGLSAFCPGTGSQGAAELPDSRVTTMTTA